MKSEAEILAEATMDAMREKLNLVADCLPLLTEKQHQLIVAMLAESYLRGRKQVFEMFAAQGIWL